ncbi:MAG TPA: tRNA 2-selenouridine(34) synthase MnmH [Chitinophagaceae bacterium]|nr:tRNA 2-selenouridine(34) synthase MnmH [Chitinophagaceae bacterium]
MPTVLPLVEFIEQSNKQLIIDVRTPAEYEQGHIHGALNLPLFTNEERAIVGTTYKQKGRQPAILIGFELIGARWVNYIRQVEEWLKSIGSKKVFVHCWRGGMRSGAMAWALKFYGFDAYLLQGGYKTFRHFYIDQCQRNYPFIILGGKTGSAKTLTLLEMQKHGEQVIDLEALANHQGSSFGSKGIHVQPSQEQFENLLAHELWQCDISKPIWLENESLTIGRVAIPLAIYHQMKQAHVIDVNFPLEERVQFLNKDYGQLDPEFLKSSVRAISKRLGPNETKLCLQAIDENRMCDFIRQTLVYYDKTYTQGKKARESERVHEVILDKIDPKNNALAVLEFVQQLGDLLQPIQSATSAL